MKTQYPRIFELEPSEKLQLLEDLWDSLVATPELVPIWNWQKKALAQRERALKKNPTATIPWKKVKERIRKRHGRN